METETKQTLLEVEGMSCQHCVRAITTSLRALGAVGAVEVNLARGTVSVVHAPSVALARLLEAVRAAGYVGREA